MKKNNLFLFTLIICIFFTFGGFAEEHRKEFSKTLDFDSKGTLKMKTYKGKIKLIPWDKNKIEIYAEIIAPDDLKDRYKKAIVKATNIDISGDKEYLSVKSNYEDVPSEKSFFGIGGSKTYPYVNYRIKIPKNIDLIIKDYKSKIYFSDLSGSFDIDTYKGEINIRKIEGDLILETYKGEGFISILKGSFEIQTYKGDITCKINEFTANSRLKTYKGDINVLVPENTKLNISENIGKRGRFVNKLNETDGGYKLRVNTSRGTIKLKYRK